MLFSNVVAATDLTLMALAGIGLRHNKVKNSMDNVKVFSFLSGGCTLVTNINHEFMIISILHRDSLIFTYSDISYFRN